MKSQAHAGPTRARFLTGFAAAMPAIAAAAAQPRTVGPVPGISTAAPALKPVITPVPTAIAAFAGTLPQGPAGVTTLASLADFERAYGAASLETGLGDAVRGFFTNGGSTLCVKRLQEPDEAGDDQAKTGIYAFDDLPNVGILAAPLERESETVDGLSSRRRAFNLALARYAVKRRAMVILDPPESWTRALARGALSSISPSADLLHLEPNAAELANCSVYFGRCATPPGRAERPPTGAIAGLWAERDASAGVWKAPAGASAVLAGVSKLDASASDAQATALDALGINPLRAFATSTAPVVFGARTLASPPSQWKYIPVRRLALFVESSIAQGTRFAIFEANAPPLRSELRLEIGAFMQSLFLQGAFAGTTPQQAYFVKCDAGNNTQATIASGVVNVTIGFAPLYPAEFVVVQIQQLVQTPQATAAPSCS